MKVAVAQMNCKTYDKEGNFGIAEQLIQEAAEQGAKLVVLPELFNAGYCCTEKDWELAEDADGETKAFFQKMSDKYGCALIGGFVEKANVQGLVYNSLLYVAPGEPTGVYRKIYLWGAEKNRFIKGEEFTHWNFEGVDIAPQICYEVGFAENAKVNALKGAEMLVYSSAFGEARYYAWDLATRARALETGCFVIASNHANIEGDVHFCGHSRIINPQGTVLCECEGDNSVAVAEIAIEEVYKQRDAIPYLRDINTKFIAEEMRTVLK